MKIFYLEDEPFLAKIVKESLESRDYEVTHVFDGKNAIQTFKSQEFSVCVLDIMVPNKNGFEIAEEIRELDPNIPILFLTAKDQTEDVLKGFEKGGNDYIKKPFSMEELIVRINNLVQLRKSSNNRLKNISDIPIGDGFIFNPIKYSLTLEDKELSLSHKEGEILKMLCANMNSVTGRKEILMKAWGDDSYFNSRNLDVYIRKIRKYFESDPSIKIKTLKSIGYQFIVE